MRDVILDFDELTSFTKQLKQLAVEMHAFEERADASASYLDETSFGRPELAQALRSIGDGWSFSRARVAAQLLVAGLAADDIGNMWQEWDSSAGAAGYSRLGQ